LETLGRELSEGVVAIVAVRGLGGIGKSQLAVEYAHRELAKGRYAITWWLSAEKPRTLAKDLALLAGPLAVAAGSDRRETIANVLTALGQREDWLLIFDNASDPELIRRRLPSRGGATIITSRVRAWDRIATQLDVEEFTRPESVAYLRRATHRNEPDAADALAAALGDLPLALAQAAAFIVASQKLTIAGCLAIYGDMESAGQLLAKRIEGYPASVATTWMLHFDQLAKRNPAAIELLRLCSYLDPDDIDYDLILAYPHALPKVLADAVRTPVGKEETVQALLNVSLVTRLDEHRIRMHRLVSQITREQLIAKKRRNDR
jgi:hypothetical protein